MRRCPPEEVHRGLTGKMSPKPTTRMPPNLPKLERGQIISGLVREPCSNSPSDPEETEGSVRLVRKGVIVN
jgi:hypothetical protein